MNVKLKRLRLSIVVFEKQLTVTSSECVFVALVIYHTKLVSRIMPPATYLVLPYFSTSSHKQHDFLKKRLLNVNCVLIFFYNFCLKHFHSRNNSARNDHKCLYVYK